MNITKHICVATLALLCGGYAGNKTDAKEMQKETVMQKYDTLRRVRKERRKFFEEDFSPALKSAIRKTFEMKEDTNVEHSIQYYDKDRFTPEEFDAKVELFAMKWNEWNIGISEERFRSRLKEVFGYEWVADIPEGLLWYRLSDKSVIMRTPDWYQSFWISEGTRSIMHTRTVHMTFSYFKDVNSIMERDTSNWSWDGSPGKVTAADLYFYYNNYVFNEDGASGVWLFFHEKYFMYHLLSKFGYDGDPWLNAKVLGNIIDGGYLPVFNGSDLNDCTFSVVHFYPEGRIKILDGVLRTVQELSTEDETKYYYWAESELLRYAGTAKIGYQPDDEEGEDDEEHAPAYYDESQKNPFERGLTFEERCEVVAHITNYLYPVYLKFVDRNSEYGDPHAHLAGLGIPDAFWNATFRDHDLFREIVRRDGYGLPELQKLLAYIKGDARFYDENGDLAPWEFDW